MAVNPSPWGLDETSRVHWDGRTLTVLYQRVRPADGEGWAFTDAAGHEHAYGSADNPYPTLERVSDGWAELSENPYDNSDVERYHLACGQCGESVWPAPGGPEAEALTGVFCYWIDDVKVDRRAARDFADLIRAGDRDRWDRIQGWLKYSAGLAPRAQRTSHG